MSFMVVQSLQSHHDCHASYIACRCRYQKSPNLQRRRLSPSYLLQPRARLRLPRKSEWKPSVSLLRRTRSSGFSLSASLGCRWDRNTRDESRIKSSGRLMREIWVKVRRIFEDCERLDRRLDKSVWHRGHDAHTWRCHFWDFMQFS